MFRRFKSSKFLFSLLIITLLSVDSILLIRSTHILSTTSQKASNTLQPKTFPSLISGSSRIPPSEQPIPIGDIPGWHQIFADDFNGTGLNISNWYPYSGQPGGDPAGWWVPSHVVVNGGLLTLKGYRDANAKPGIFVTGGVGMKGSYAQTYGKYEVRMRVDGGDGISPIALLWPKENIWPPEIDFFEETGNRTTTYAWLHCGSNGNDHCRVERELTGYDFSQWHTIGVEWTASKLVYTIDGTIWATVTGSVVPSIPMVLDLQTESLSLDSSPPAEVDMQIDWVVVYAPVQ